jgi:hypothetical protein
MAAHDPLLIDESTLQKAVPVELRETLRGNDHIFVEASRLEQGVFYFRTWGYGQHDKNGFRWNCQYKLLEETLTCDAGY